MIRPKIKVTVKAERLKKLQAEFKKSRGAYVSIGIHEEAGEYEDGVSVVQVAFWNEFGTEHIPSRPFMRAAIYDKVHLINEWRKEVLEKVVEGEITIKKGLEILGFRIRELIKNNIVSNMPPPNAPSTIAAKKAAGVAPRTLMNTTLLLRSVEYRVVMGGGEAA